MSLPIPGFEWNHNGIANVLRALGWISYPLSKADDGFITLRLIKKDDVKVEVPQLISLNQNSVSRYVYRKFGKDIHALFDELRQIFYFCESERYQNIPYLAVAFTYKLVDGFKHIDDNISGVPPDISQEPAKLHQARCYGYVWRGRFDL